MARNAVAQTPIRIVHLTDLHVTRPDLVQVRRHGVKRRLGYRNWSKRRQHTHQDEQFQRLRELVLAQQPDLILVTGDVCQLGTAAELAQARATLESLGSPQTVCFVPGNHDLYQADSVGALTANLGPYAAAEYPWVRRVQGVEVIGLNSAVPTPPLSARGALGSAQLARLETLLAQPQPDARLVALHHPPSPGQCSWRKALKENVRLIELLQNGSVDLALHGHLHKNIDLPLAQLLVCGTASASALGAEPARTASWRRIEIDRESAELQVFTHCVGREEPVAQLQRRLLNASQAPQGGDQQQYLGGQRGQGGR